MFKVILPSLGLAAAVSLSATWFGVGTPPGDTYFSLAITENSHNHVGAKRLFVDFQQAPFALADQSKGEVVSVEVAPGGIVPDGDDSEWDPTYFTTVSGLVQSNYPLSEYIDAVPTDITVGSAWDDTYVYFLVQWADAGETASVRPSKWIYGNQGSGEQGWNAQVNVGATPGAPNAAAVNSSGHLLAGAESEDRIFFMFPVVDTEANYTPTGPGCALYCHANLDLDDPDQDYTGDGVIAMHTNVAGDVADIWHWKAARTEPSGRADDKHIVFGVETDNGRVSDSGTAAYSGNSLSGDHPTWMHMSGLGFLGDVLLDVEAVAYSGTPVQGNEIPANRSLASTGSRGDVETAAFFDAGTKVWTVEFRRLRDTGNSDDHNFNGAAAAPPTLALVTTVDPVAGAALYDSWCLGCHEADGLGIPDAGAWITPRVQRTSGSDIYNAIATLSAMSPLQGALTEQEMEDIAAYLQTQAEFDPLLQVLNLVGGEKVKLVAEPLQPGDQVWFAFSLSGAGPTATPYGVTVDLSPPITKFGPYPANASGKAVKKLNVPPGATGQQVWLQAVVKRGPDFLVTNLVSETVQ